MLCIKRSDILLPTVLPSAVFPGRIGLFSNSFRRVSVSGIGNTDIGQLDNGAWSTKFLSHPRSLNDSQGQIISRTGRYRVGLTVIWNWRMPTWLREQTIIHVGFAVWAIASGCLSTISESTAKGLLVFFMLLAGTGAGQVGVFSFHTLSYDFPCNGWRPCKQQRLRLKQVFHGRICRWSLQYGTWVRYMLIMTADVWLPHFHSFPKFVRLLGGTLSLAIGATIMSVTLDHIFFFVVMLDSLHILW